MIMVCNGGRFIDLTTFFISYDLLSKIANFVIKF